MVSVVSRVLRHLREAGNEQRRHRHLVAAQTEPAATHEKHPQAHVYGDV